MGYGNSVSIDLFTKKISITTENQEKSVGSFPVDIFAGSPASINVEAVDSSTLNEYISLDRFNKIIVSGLDREVYASLKNTVANFSTYIDFYSSDSNLWNGETTITSSPTLANLFIQDSNKGATIVQPLSSLGIGVGVDGAGEALYTTPGTYSWTCPAGVTSVSVVAVGAGGSGGYQWSSGGGGGGGLGWKNSISVTPGNTYTVVVGDKGGIVANATNNGGQGGNSYFIDTTTVCGFGAGQGGTGSSGTGHGAWGGGYSGDGGGVGGNGAAGGSWTHGGGGAGGYTGNGASRYNGTDATGGGGGAGQYYSSTYGVGAGGGVGLYGEGPSGVTYANGTGYGGRGGSGGGDGMAGETSITSSPNIWEWSAQYSTTGNNQILGGQFGGGGGGSGTSKGGGYGGTGAVRIIWGSGLSFPSDASNASPYVDSGTPGNYQIIFDSSGLMPISYDSNYYSYFISPSSKLISIQYVSEDSYSAGEPSLSSGVNNVLFTINDSARNTILVDTLNQLFIKTSKDIAFFSGVNSNSQRVEFKIENNIDLIYTDENGISKFEQVDEDNNPRPIVISQGTAEEISTGPVQSWF
jgi:hypothetical protein